jgi:hypothetical protein
MQHPKAPAQFLGSMLFVLNKKRENIASFVGNNRLLSLHAPVSIVAVLWIST